MSDDTTGTAPSQAVLDEAADPTLSQDFFKLNDRKVQIKSLFIKYDKQFTRAFEPIVEALSVNLATNESVFYTDETGATRYRPKTVQTYLQDMTPSDLVNIGKSLIELSDVLPRLVQIICHNDGYLITDDELDNSILSFEDMQGIVLNAWKKNGRFNKEIGDFFENVLQKGKQGLGELLASLKSQTGETSSTST